MKKALPFRAALGLVIVSLVCMEVVAKEAPQASSVAQTEGSDASAHSQTDKPSESLLVLFYVFVLASFLGYQLITRVPPLLHTPLMSGTNAISGISLVGSLVAAGAAYHLVSTILGFFAVVCSTCNVVGGFLITDRMLKMFKKEDK